MKLLIYTLLLISHVLVHAQEKKEEPEVIPRGTLTINNRSKNGCYIWFACYSDKTGKAKKLWHPDYNPVKKTVKPLILYPNQGAQITIPDDECFYTFFGWWGTIFKKVEKKAAKEHRCRNITVTFKGDKELVIDYNIELTEKEKEAAEKKAKEEAEDKTAGVPVPASAQAQKKGYWV